MKDSAIGERGTTGGIDSDKFDFFLAVAPWPSEEVRYRGEAEGLQSSIRVGDGNEPTGSFLVSCTYLVSRNSAKLRKFLHLFSGPKQLS